MNPYKILTYVLAIALIATVFYFKSQTEKLATFIDEKGNKVQREKGMLDELFAFNEVMEIDSETLEKWKSLNSSFDPNTGTPLPIDVAHRNLDSFRKWNKKKFNFIKEIKPNGFAFGINRIRTLVDMIDSINIENNNIIAGIRINLTHTPNTDKKKKPTIDALIIPIKADGNNYIDLTNDEGENYLTPNDLLLNTSLPCPDNCGQQ